MSFDSDALRIIRALESDNGQPWAADAEREALEFYEQFASVFTEPIRRRLGTLLQAKFGAVHENAFSFASIAGSDSWLSKYVEFTLGHEAPEMFHFWVGVSVLGAALRRRAWFDKGYYSVFCNHYVILVAPTGVCKKTVAAEIGIRLLREAVPELTIINEKVTPEALLESLQSYAKEIKRTEGRNEAVALIFAPELSVFLGRQSYNEALIDLLTSLHDARPVVDHITRTKAKIRVENVAVSTIGATTPDSIDKILPQSAHAEGYMGRNIFAVQNSTPRSFAFPEKPPPHLRTHLIERLHRYSRLEGQFAQTPEALEWHLDWYASRKATEDPRMAGYYQRKQDHMIRLAMVIAVSDSAGEPENMGWLITERIYQRALAALEETEKYMPEAFARIEISEAGRQSDRILRQLATSSGWVSHSHLLKINHRFMNRTQFNEAVQTLLGAGLIDVMEKADQVGRPRFYRIKAEGKHLAQPDIEV